MQTFDDIEEEKQGGDTEPVFQPSKDHFPIRLENPVEDVDVGKTSVQP